MNTVRITKYLMTGIIGITVNLGLYRILIEYLHVHYLAGSLIAVTCSTIVGFIFQKYWTFEERTHADAPMQFLMYAFVAVVNIGLNTLIVYVLTGLWGAYYLLSQAAGAAAIALWSFFAYREIIFRVRSGPVQPPRV